MEWNKTIASTPADKLPHGLTPDTKVFVPNGLLRVSDGELSQYDLESLEVLEKGGVRHFQHVTVRLFFILPYTLSLRGRVSSAKLKYSPTKKTWPA